MTVEEAKKVIEELKENGMTYEQVENVIEKSKGKGMTDEQICDCLYKMYRDDLIDLDQFDALAKLVKYELTQEFIETEKRRLEKSDLSYILGMKLSVIEEIYLLKGLIKKVKDKDILEDIKEALYCLRYTLSDETIEYLESIKEDLRFEIAQKRKQDYHLDDNKIQCINCLYCFDLNPFDKFCMKYKTKPIEVLNEGKDCSKYKKLNFLRMDDMLKSIGIKLVVKDGSITNEYEIHSKEDLIDGIKDYIQVFLPEDNDYILDLYNSSEYEKVLDEISEYNNDNYNYLMSLDENERKEHFRKLLNYAVVSREALELLDKVEKMDSIADIVLEIYKYNEIFKKAEIDINFIIEDYINEKKEE